MPERMPAVVTRSAPSSTNRGPRSHVVAGYAVA